MSAQFGRWNFDGRPVDPNYLDSLKAAVDPYGPDGGGSRVKDGFFVIYRAFHTTLESRNETQPHVTPSGAILTWDGRLDNRSEIIRRLANDTSPGSPDVAIVAAAYDKWNTGCFAMLVGDWALTVWDPNNLTLILAKDPIGLRHLYYTYDREQITWSTVLDPIVLLGKKTFPLCEEYVAGWLSFFPATHLTPYVGIRSVPPSSSILISAEKQTVTKYWDFDPAKQIRYKTDPEYEEHFRAVFADAVHRRLHSDSPVLAELSGGIDSSSIVCMADTLIARGDIGTPRLETISYYNDSEPNWNERPYFTKVEEKRGRTGCHIDVGEQESFVAQIKNGQFGATPGSVIGVSSTPRLELAACMLSHTSRVVLSGIGGDEVLGGVPTSTPELQDLLVSARLGTLAHQLKVWALIKRTPWFYLLLEAVRGFLPVSLGRARNHQRPVTWLTRDFFQRHRAVLGGYERRLSVFGPLPSFQHSISTVEALRRRLTSFVLRPDMPIEKRYPYLDRNLLEFVFAIPREQLVRPGHRRSLMRRALAGIVPEEILNRKRKAYNAQTSMLNVSAQFDQLNAMSRYMILVSLGIVHAESFSEALEGTRQGRAIPIVTLLRTFVIEAWLRSLSREGFTTGIHECPPTLRTDLKSTPISAEEI